MPRRSQLLRPRKRPKSSICPLHVEQLESRLLLAADWRNPVNVLDVNGDQHVTPIDALWVANDLHRNGARGLTVDRGGPAAPFLDVNGDGFVAPSDAIRVIDALNAGQHSPYVLDERAGRVATTITIGLGQEYGPRLYTFGIEADFDNSGGVGGDRVEVYLVDPRNPDQTLLDGGEPGTPVFVLEPGVSSYSDENVRYDGTEVQLNLGSLGQLSEGELQFRLVTGNSMAGSRVTIRPTSNELLPGLLITDFPSLPAPADGTQTVILDAEFIRGSGRFDEIGLVMLDDAGGAVDGVAPDEPGYEDAIRNSSSRSAIAAGGDSSRTQRQLRFPLDVPLALYAFHSDPWLGSIEDHVQISEVALGAWEVGWDEPPPSSGGVSSLSIRGPEDALVRVVAQRNRPVTSDPGLQITPTLAVNPLDPDHVVVAYTDYSLVDTGYGGISVAVSRDGGTRWHYSEIAAPDKFKEASALPDVRFDHRGRVFVAFQAATFADLKLGTNPPDIFDATIDLTLQFRSNNGIFVARSDDGGMEWNQPVAVVSHIHDERTAPFKLNPGLSIDTFPKLPDGKPNPNYGNLYVVWTVNHPPGQFPGFPESTGGGDIMIAVSRDIGATWETQLEQDERWIDVNGDGIRQPGEVSHFLASVLEHGIAPSFVPGISLSGFPRVTVGPEGDIYVASWSLGDVGVNHSTDGGSSFLQPDRDAGHRLPFRDFALFTLENYRFETFSLEAIAADPTRPGRVYSAVSFPVRNASGEVVDRADIRFARSGDHGKSWDTSFLVGSSRTNILNDDSGGRIANGLSDNEVFASQGFERLMVDDQGNIAVVWADQRRDPAKKLVDVFGTVSTDGGETFSPNFRITSVSFDAESGSFTDPTGKQNFYLGPEMVDLELSNKTVYVSWTDTRAGNRDIYFARYPLDPAPPPLNDRFEPNDNPRMATILGRVAKRVLPQLATVSSDEDWFSVEAAATGSLTATASTHQSGDQLRLELWNNEATELLASGNDLFNESGGISGEQIVAPSKSGQELLLRVLQTNGSDKSYTLDVQTLTKDLGSQVFGEQNRTMEVSDEFLYHLSTAAAGTLELQLTSGSNFQGTLNLELLDPRDFSRFASGAAVLGSSQVGRITLPVDKDQAFLIHVFGARDSRGQFSIHYTNLDQLTISDESKTLRFPIGSGSSELAVVDLNRDQHPDLVVSNTVSDTLNVLLANEDGTFQAQRQFAVGAYITPTDGLRSFLPNLDRSTGVGDFNGDHIPDIATINSASSDVSVLLGRGDGTFDPQRRFNATRAPGGMDIGDLNGDGLSDLVITDSPISKLDVAVLLARGDGTFERQETFFIPTPGGDQISRVRIADFDNDGSSDLLIHGFTFGTTGRELHTFLGNGDGTFVAGSAFRSFPFQAGFTVADLDVDGNLDIVVIHGGAIPLVGVHLGRGDGTFSALLQEPGYSTGLSWLGGVAVADVGSELILPDFSTRLGPPDGRPDIVVSNSGLVTTPITGPGTAEPEVVILPGQFDAAGNLTGYGLPQRLVSAKFPLSIVAADLDNDDVQDIAAVDQDAALVVYGNRPNILPNDTPETARILGPVVHLVEQTRTIVPGHDNAFFKLTVPTEAVSGAGDQVIDFSGRFEATSGAGISMEVLDADGNVLGSGERFRVRAAQGQELTLHVFGVAVSNGVRGSGAYTLVIDVLPQVVSTEAQALLPGVSERPGGPTTSIVLTLQGDRLDRVTAEDTDNYAAHHAGLDGTLGTTDDVSIPIDGIVYSPSTNVDVSTGKILPTAVRQTVTLDFADPLPPGSYSIDLSAGIQTEPFNEQEAELLSPRPGFNGHPVVTLNTQTGQITDGSRVEAIDLVLPSGDLGSFTAFGQGTPFLSQLHADMGALLDAILTARGDDPAITGVLTNQMLGSLDPALGQFGQRPTDLLGIWLDPVSMDLTDPNGDHIVYDLKDDTLIVDRDDCFVLVIWNIELIICPVFGGEFRLDVADVPETARGGVIILQQDTNETKSLTDDLRAGVSTFTIEI